MISFYLSSCAPDTWQHAADFFSDILVSRRRHKLPRTIRSVFSLTRKARTMLSIPLISPWR